MATKRVARTRVRILVLAHGDGLPQPAYQSKGAAGFDLVAAVGAKTPIMLKRGGFVRVPTGLIFEIPNGFEGQVRPRSGLAAHDGVTVLNAPGTIDSDYRGEVQVLLINHGPKALKIERGMRIAQMILAPVTQAQLVAATEVAATVRGTGGFGSTGLAPATKTKPRTSKPKPRKAPTRTFNRRAIGAKRQRRK